MLSRFKRPRVATESQNSLIRTIVSGGQTGVDRAALDAAIKSGIPHGGYCPKGRLAEDGTINPRYQLTETDSSVYEVRTEKNVIHSDGTLILVKDEPMGGTLFTIDMAKKHSRPYLLFYFGKDQSIDSIADWMKTNYIRTLNVAGPRASQTEGIYELAFSLIEKLASYPAPQPSIRARL